MINPAEKYRQELEEEMYMEHYESGPSDLHKLLREEHKRVKKRRPEPVTCGTCERYERPTQVCNLCRKGQIAQLEIDLADVYKEYQDLAGVHNQVCALKDKRIKELELTLQITRVRMQRKSMTTLAIDGVIEKKGN